MNKNYKSNRNILCIFFFFLLFSASFNFRSSEDEKVFFIEKSFLESFF